MTVYAMDVDPDMDDMLLFESSSTFSEFQYPCSTSTGRNSTLREVLRIL